MQSLFPFERMKSINTCIRIFADLSQINRCREHIYNINSPISSLAKILNISGNEVRLKILFLLHEEQKMCPCDLSDILQMSTPAISQHLRKMKDSGMIVPSKSGQTIFYSIPENRRKLVAVLFDFLAPEKSKINHPGKQII